MNRPTEVERFLATLPRVHPLRAPGVSEATILAKMAADRAARLERDFDRRLQAWLDAVAATRGFGTDKVPPMASAAGYVTSIVNRFRSDALLLTAWRDQVWLQAYRIREAVKSGQRGAPDNFDELKAELPQPPSFPA